MPEDRWCVVPESVGWETYEALAGTVHGLIQSARGCLTDGEPERADVLLARADEVLAVRWEQLRALLSKARTRDELEDGAEEAAEKGLLSLWVDALLGEGE